MKVPSPIYKGFGPSGLTKPGCFTPYLLDTDLIFLLQNPGGWSATSTPVHLYKLIVNHNKINLS